MPLRDLTSGIGAGDLLRIVSADSAAGDVLVTGVSLDSRSVLPGDLYAALPGFHAHGADFAADALAAGAVAVLTDPAGQERLRDLATRESTAVPVLLADQPREVLGEVAATVYGHPAEALTVLGVTGTNGKTTTAYLIESALRAPWSAHRAHRHCRDPHR